MSNIINKVKDALSGDHKHSDPEGTHGPHSSRAANAADPRIDSDADHRASGLNTTGNTAGYSGTTGTTGDYSAGTTGTSGLNTTGNTAGYSGSTGTTGTSGVGSYGEAREGQQGPHSSRIANTLDPRIDSDRDGSRTVGSTGYGSNTGTTGYGADSTASTGYGSTTGSTGYGADSTTSNTGYGADVGASTYGSGPGPAQNTAGPHKSDTLNKLDPRVDLDGSKTVGGDQTYQSGQQSAAYSGPPDAAKLPPSALRRELGDPSIEHGDHGHDRERRNSAITHQEQHRGI